MIIFVFCSSLSFAQEVKREHPIDMWLSKCIQQDDSTAGMRECNGKAYEMWDKEMNKNYKELMNVLSPEGKKLLKKAQLSWIKFRDDEFKLNSQIIGSKDGTMWLIVGDSFRVGFVKRRSMELGGYIGDLKE
jgi:uncharacterized protein YecT (DUF1311 family)